MLKLLKTISLNFAKVKTKADIDPQLAKAIHSQKITHIPNKQLPSSNKRNILITSALPYVNNKPHLGNIIGASLSADVYARFCRQMGYNVLFISGTDQYGTATEVKSLQEKCTPQQICDKYHLIHKQIYQWFDISFDHFGRTSHQLHSSISQEIFTQIYNKDLLSEKTTTQLHCKNCNLFLADRYVRGRCIKCSAVTRGDQCQSCSIIFNNLTEQLSDIQCSICNSKPQPQQTNHLYLKLEKQVPALKKWLQQEKGMQKWSNNAKGITKGWFSLPMQERCITRDLKWGVPVPLPAFKDKVFYVWFQAPLGYISMTAALLGESYKNWWIRQQSINVQLNQFMGKDNVLFHSIICPASLTGTGKDWILPSRISATEFLNYEGGKFSKSHNIGVFGDECEITGLSSQYWRYYLLRVRPENFDSEFTWNDFAQKCNKELLNCIGNLVQRVVKYSFSNFGTKILELKQQDLQSEQINLINSLQAKVNQYTKFMENVQISSALTSALEISFEINSYIAKTQFWKNSRKQVILALLLRIIKVYSIILSPFIPSLSAKVNFILGFNNTTYKDESIFFKEFKTSLMNSLNGSIGIREPIPLIRQITSKDIKIFKEKFGTHKK